MRHKCPEEGGEDYFAIHEVCEAGPGKAPMAWTKDPIDVGGTSIADLRRILNRMKEALKEPVLDYPEEQA